MTIFEKPEPLTITVYLDEYTELVRKATLYDELKAGHILLVKTETREEAILNETV